jgi:hypothetical protein
MTRRARLAPFLLVAVTALACTVVGAPQAATGDPDCTPRTAWAGSETTPQRGQATLVQIPVRTGITITHLTVSDSFAEHTANYGEQLLLIGVSDGPLTLSATKMPLLAADPTFDPLRIDTTAASHNEDPTMSTGMIAARIYKSATGAAGGLVDLPLNRPVGAGGVVWVRYDSLSPVNVPTDPEVQIILTYLPAGC